MQKIKSADHNKRKKEKGMLVPLFASLLFLIGACIFFYPSVSDYFAKKRQVAVIQQYQGQVEEKNKESLAAEWERAEIYNENLAGDPVRDPFVPGSGYALPENYEEVLNVDGVMGYVEIPKIDVMLPIYHGSSEEVLQKGIGHIESTALPIGGLYRNCVLTGHRGLPSSELFTRLDEMEEGDIFLLHVLDQTLAYEVFQIKTVLPTELDALRAYPEKDVVTLITCTPYGINTHRLLVQGSRTTYVPPKKENGAHQNQERGLIFKFSDLGVAVGIFLLLVLVIVWRIRKRGKQNDER